jgi:outer membrane receptor protein involved in Fe transport
VRTDGSRATDYTQSFTTPWLALAWQFMPGTTGLCQLGPGHRVRGRAQPRPLRQRRAGTARIEEPALGLRASALWLKARREGGADASANGLRPTNVPAQSLKLQGAWRVDAVPSLALLAFISREGERMVLPDNSVATEGWTRVDLGLRYAHQAHGQRWLWRLGVDNVADQRAWKETPFQYGHAYLYPMAPRTWRAALNITL